MSWLETALSTAPYREGLVGDSGVFGLVSLSADRDRPFAFLSSMLSVQAHQSQAHPAIDLLKCSTAMSQGLQMQAPLLLLLQLRLHHAHMCALGARMEHRYSPAPVLR